MYRLAVFVCLLSCCLSYNLHLKIAERLAVPHYRRHVFDYPQIDFGAFLQNNRIEVPRAPRPPAAPRQPISEQRQPIREQFEERQPLQSPRQPLSLAEQFERRQSPTFREANDVRQAARQPQAASSQPSSFGRQQQQADPSFNSRSQSRFFNLHVPNLASEISSEFNRRQR